MNGQDSLRNDFGDQGVRVPVKAKHEPQCNERCTEESHFLRGEEDEQC